MFKYNKLLKAINKMLVVFKVLRRLVKKLDLFSSIQLLRFKGDAETKTLTGGMISFVIYVYLAVTFSSMIIDTFHKVVITSVSDTTQADQPTPLYLSTQNKGSEFMLGVELYGFDLTTGPRYFDILLRNSYMKLAEVTDDSIYYNLVPCTKDHWQHLPNISTLFDSVQMFKWLCMPLDINPVLKGTYSSELQTTLDVIVQTCSNDTDPTRPCASPEEIEAFLANNSPFYFTPYFYNPLLNPQSQNYLSTYLETKYYTMFGAGCGSQMYIYQADFQITTDQSILPFAADHKSTGPIVSFISKNNYNMGNTSNVFTFISFFRAPQSIVIARGFRKAVDVFSYVGGLLGAFVIIFIIINFYNQCSYEMNFAASLYKPQKDCPTNAAKFNLAYYLLTGIYNIFKSVKINCQNWKSISFFDQTRQQMVRQLDVKYLFKKLSILQNAIMLLLTKPQLKGIMLQHKMTIAQARKTRHIYTIKNRLKKYLKQKMKGQDQPVQLQKSPDISFKISTGEDKVNYMHSKSMSQTIINIENQNQPNYQGNNPQSHPKQKFLLSDSEESSSESDGEEDTSQFEKIFDDLNELREQSKQNSVISKKILKDLDPFIKKIYENRSNSGQRHYYELREGESSVDNLEVNKINNQQIAVKSIYKQGNEVINMDD